MADPMLDPEARVLSRGVRKPCHDFMRHFRVIFDGPARTFTLEPTTIASFEYHR